MYKLYIDYGDDGDFITTTDCAEANLKETARDIVARHAKMSAQVKDYRAGHYPWDKEVEDLPKLENVGVNIDKLTKGKYKYYGYIEFVPTIEDGKYVMMDLKKEN